MNNAFTELLDTLRQAHPTLKALALTEQMGDEIAISPVSERDGLLNLAAYAGLGLRQQQLGGRAYCVGVEGAWLSYPFIVEGCQYQLVFWSEHCGERELIRLAEAVIPVLTVMLQ